MASLDISEDINKDNDQMALDAQSRHHATSPPCSSLLFPALPCSTLHFSALLPRSALPFSALLCSIMKTAKSDQYATQTVPITRTQMSESKTMLIAIDTDANYSTAHKEPTRHLRNEFLPLCADFDFDSGL